MKKIIILMIFLLIPIAYSVGIQDAYYRMIACYDFENNTLNDSMGKYHATSWSGSIITTQFGTKAFRMRNTSTDYIKISSSFSPFNYTNISIVIFANFTNFTSDAFFQYRKTGDSSYLSMDSSVAGLNNYVRLQANPPTYVNNSANALPNPLQSNVWAMMSFTSNKSVNSVWMNTTYLGNFTVDTWFRNMTGATPVLTIGNIDGASNNRAKEIEAIYIYNGTINSSVITQLYNSGTPLSCAGIITGTTTTNSSCNNTLTGNCQVSCSDNCLINTTTNCVRNLLVMGSTGKLTILSPVYMNNLTIENQCKVYVFNQTNLYSRGKNA